MAFRVLLFDAFGKPFSKAVTVVRTLRRATFLRRNMNNPAPKTSKQKPILQSLLPNRRNRLNPSNNGGSWAWCCCCLLLVLLVLPVLLVVLLPLLVFLVVLLCSWWAPGAAGGAAAATSGAAPPSLLLAGAAGAAGAYTWPFAPMTVEGVWGRSKIGMGVALPKCIFLDFLQRNP